MPIFTLNRFMGRISDMATSEDHQIPEVRLDQSLSVLADVVACYIGATKTTDGDGDLKSLHQMCVAIFLHALLMKSRHKEEMAKIVDAIAIALREAAGTAGLPKATPSVSDNDEGAITVSHDGRKLRGWNYANDEERRQKMLQAREYVEGYCDGREALA
jgi:hypothetical protein